MARSRRRNRAAITLVCSGAGILVGVASLLAAYWKPGHSFDDVALLYYIGLYGLCFLLAGIIILLREHK